VEKFLFADHWPLTTAFQGGFAMTMDRYIRLIAGTFVLVSLGLGYTISPYWFLFTAFVGLNLIQSSFTKWCLMEDILAKLGVKRA